ncbi:MAG: M48 family metallopeptidase [Burkholderiaceae bacterium]
MTFPTQQFPRRPGRAARLAALALAAALGVACTSVQTTRGGVVGVERTQRMSTLVSEADLRQGAVKAYAQVVGEAKQKGQLNVPAAQQRRVDAISRRLIAATPVFRPDARNWQWEVTVIRSDEVNAWCMPGGKIAVYTGLIDKLQATDAELAAVIGHEIAHALREHSRERASEQVTSGLLLQGAVLMAGGGQASLDMAQLAYQVTVGLPHSRLHETEADRIGVELAARAGYDPYGAVSVWKKMAALGGAGQPEFLSTHPSAATRIQDLEVYARRVEPLYRGAAR